MPQVVSKNLTKSGDTNVSLEQQLSSTTRKDQLVVAFHGAAASIYGYAICWQNVSEASRQLYLRTNPLIRVYGRWRFLTFNCLILQFIAFSLCFTAHFVPKLKRPRDFVFTSLAFPIGILVVTTFWGVWFTLGREFIFPAEIEPYYPIWLNHVTHTIIAPINLIELLALKKRYSSNIKAMTTLTGYAFTYTAYLLYIKWQTGRFVYPFLNYLSVTGASVFIAGTMCVVFGIYKIGKVVHDAVHRIKPYKHKLGDLGKKEH